MGGRCWVTHLLKTRGETPPHCGQPMLNHAARGAVPQASWTRVFVCVMCQLVSFDKGRRWGGGGEGILPSWQRQTGPPVCRSEPKR